MDFPVSDVFTGLNVFYLTRFVLLFLIKHCAGRCNCSVKGEKLWPDWGLNQVPLAGRVNSQPLRYGAS